MARGLLQKATEQTKARGAVYGSQISDFSLVAQTFAKFEARQESGRFWSAPAFWRFWMGPRWRMEASSSPGLRHVQQARSSPRLRLRFRVEQGR